VLTCQSVRLFFARTCCSGVLDVGGGHGEVAFQLVNLNRVPATVVDPRPLRLRRFARKAGELLRFGIACWSNE